MRIESSGIGWNTRIYNEKGEEILLGKIEKVIIKPIVPTQPLRAILVTRLDSVAIDLDRGNVEIRKPDELRSPKG